MTTPSFPPRSTPKTSQRSIHDLLARRGNMDGFNANNSPASWWFLVGAITLLSFGLRIVAISKDSIWYDEAFTVAMLDRAPRDLTAGRWGDPGNPPLYYLAASAWGRLTGESEAALRSLTVLFSVLTVPLLCLLGRRLIGKRAALFAGFLFSISPFAVELANEARPYSLLGMLVTLSTVLFVEWLIHRLTWLVLAYALSVFLCLYTHYYAVFLPAAHAFALAILIWRSPRRIDGSSGAAEVNLAFDQPIASILLPWLGAMALAAAIGSTWLPIFVNQLRSTGNLQRMAHAWLTQFLATPMVLGLGRTLGWRDVGTMRLALISTASLLLFWFPALYGILRRDRSTFSKALLGSWAVFPILIPFAAAVMATPLYSARYAYVGLPAFLLLVASGLELLRPKPRRVAWILIIFSTALSLYNYSVYPLKDDWRTIAREFLDHRRADDTIVFDPGYESMSFFYYARRLPGSIPEVFSLNVDGGKLIGVLSKGGVWNAHADQDRTEEILSHPRVWLVSCPMGSGDATASILERRGYGLVEAQLHGRIHVRRFEKHSLLTPARPK